MLRKMDKGIYVVFATDGFPQQFQYFFCKYDFNIFVFVNIDLMMVF